MTVEYSDQMALGFLLVLAAIAIVTLLANQQKKLQRLRQCEKELQVQLRHQKELDDYMERVRFLRHDANNYLLTMQALLANGQVEKAKEFLDTVYVRFGLDAGGMFSDDSLVDELLAEQFRAAEEAGILCNFYTEISGVAQYDHAILCCAVSSMLEDALARCKLSVKPNDDVKNSIYFNCTVTDEAKLLIQCTINSTRLPEPRQKGGFISRIKKHNTQPRNTVLNNLAASYQGYCEYGVEDGKETMTLTFVLPGPPVLSKR